MRHRALMTLAVIPAWSLGAQTARFARVERLILDEMARGEPHGLAVAVGRADSIIWEAGFGLANREKQVRVTANTPFYLASVTKSIIGTAAMILHQHGRLSFDRPANDYLGTSPLWSPAWDARKVTVRHLLTHTAGLSTFDASCDPNRPRCAEADFDALVERYGVLVWPPGEHFDYSNFGYHVVAEIVERASGRKLADFLREELFRPLGMTDASLGVNSQRVKGTAVPYSWTRGALPLIPGTSASSSIYASVHDLVRFGMMHAKVRRPGMRALVSEAAIDTMQAAVVAADGSGNYGFGWSVENDRYGYRSLLSQGGTDYAQAWLRIIPSEQIVVAVIANRGVGLPEVIVDAVLGELLPRYAMFRDSAQAQAHASGTAPASVAPATVDSMLSGVWQGSVRTETGDLPLEIEISTAGTTRAAIGRSGDERAGRARMGTRLFVVRIPGGLDTPDSTSGRQIAMYLKPRQRVLNGVLTTSAPIASGLVGRVSYWVEFRRRP